LFRASISLQLGSILAENFQRSAKTASLLPSPTAANLIGFLVLKLRIFVFLPVGCGVLGPPSLLPLLFCVSSR